MKKEMILNSKLKILVLPSWYPSRVEPHLGSFVQRQTEAAAIHADMCVLFVSSEQELDNIFDIESKTVNNVFTVNVYCKKSKNPLRKVWNFFKAYRIGWNHILGYFGKPDLIHLNVLWPAGLFAYYLKIFLGFKYIITEHWTGYLDSDGAYQRSSVIKKFYTKIVARNAELIMPVSRDLKNAMKTHGLDSRFEIVNNVVDTSTFYPVTVLKKSNGTTFLHVSTTFDEQKNVSGILEAVKMLAEKRTDFELRIVSEMDFSSHEKTADKLGILNKYVFFESAKQAHGVAEAMRNAHCFVLFSNYENLPVVIIEAMATGLPVISTAVGGIPEHINSEFGVLLQPRDIEGLSKAMAYMIDNRENYNAVKIRNYAVTNFSYEAVGEKFNEIYRKII